MTALPFIAALDMMFRFEGGFVDDPLDRGGATNLGVSLRFALGLEPWEKLELDMDGDGDLDVADIKALTRDKATDLYRRHFWNAVKGDDLPGPLATHAFDCAVNQGPGTARLLLQKALGVKVDGRIGPVTLKAAEEQFERNPFGLLDEFAARRMVHYAAIRDSERFILGWSRRLMGVHAVCNRAI